MIEFLYIQKVYVEIIVCQDSVCHNILFWFAVIWNICMFSVCVLKYSYIQKSVCYHYTAPPKYSPRVSSWSFTCSAWKYHVHSQSQVFCYCSPVSSMRSSILFKRHFWVFSLVIRTIENYTWGRTVKKTYWLHFASWEVRWDERRTDLLSPHAKAGVQTGPLIASWSGWCIFWWLDYSSDRTIWNGHQRL